MHDEVPRGSRRAIRRAVALDCEIIGSHSDEPLRHRIADLSPYGLWIPTPDPLRTGQTVVACFEPEGWQGGELMVFAEVARVATARGSVDQPGVGMGLELVDLQPEEHRRLAAWLARQRMPVPRRRRPVPRRAWRVPSSLDAGARSFRPLASAWR